MMMMMIMMMMAVCFVQIYINVRGGYGGTPDFKWRGWSNGDKNQNPTKSLRLPTTPPKIPGLKNNPPKNPTPNFRALDGTTTTNIVVLIMLRVLPPCCSGMQTVQQLPTTHNNKQQGEQSGVGADYSAPHGPGADATCNILKKVGGCFYLLASNVASVCTLHGAFELTSNKLSAKR